MRVVDVNRVVEFSGELPDAATADEAWLVQEVSRHGDPKESDERLRQACRSRGPQLRAQLVLLPPALDSSVPRALEAVSQGACRMLRVCPGPNGHGYPLLDWILSPLPETCERENLALAIDYQDPGVPWSEVIGFARAFPAVPMILIGASVGDDRAIPAALNVAPNLILELSSIGGERALTPLVDRFGAHRFVYGSGRRLSNNASISLALAGRAGEGVFFGTADAIESGTWREAHL